MDDLSLIDCLERMRTHLVTAHPRLEQRRQQIREANYRALSADELKEHIVAVVLDLDTDTAAGQRERDLVIHQIEALLQTTENAYPLPAAWAGGAAHLSGAAADQLKQCFAVAEAQTGSVQNFSAGLQKCNGIQAAAQYVERELPGLRGRKTYQLLGRIGYPAAVPSRDTMRLMHRLGLLTEVKDDLAGRRVFFDQMQRMSSITATPLPELDLLLGTFARGDSRLRLKGVCATEPRCADCCVSNYCVSFRFRGAPQRVETTPIKEWARDERPRERLLAGERLSSSELLGIILRTGSGSQSAVDLGRALLQKFGSLHRLESAPPHEIAQVKGIGLAKAAEIRAAIELGRRIVQPAADDREGLKQISSSRDVFDFYRPRYKSATQEEFLLLALNTKNRIQREISISVGTINASIVHPRDVFNHALREAAAGVIFVHNHPSGDPAPSPEDHALTRRLVEAGNLLGIKVLDHVIIGAQRYYSFADEGALV